MQISKLLNEHNIEHRVDEQTNIVEHRSKGRRYVNNRREGKTGLRLVINQPYIGWTLLIVIIVGTHVNMLEK